MNELTIVIIVIVLVLSFFLHYESKFSELTYVVSQVDNKQYLVRNREDKQEAADLLATVRKNLDKIVEYLKNNNSSDVKVERLVKNYGKISESMLTLTIHLTLLTKVKKLYFVLEAKMNIKN